MQSIEMERKWIAQICYKITIIIDKRMNYKMRKLAGA